MENTTTLLNLFIKYDFLNNWNQKEISGLKL